MEDHNHLENFKYTLSPQDGYSVKYDRVRAFSKIYVARYATAHSVPAENVIRSYFFGSAKVAQELSKDGAVGIRVYYGVDEKGIEQLYLVAAKANGDDIPENKEGSPVGSPKPCPPYCP